MIHGWGRKCKFKVCKDRVKPLYCARLEGGIAVGQDAIHELAATIRADIGVDAEYPVRGSFKKSHFPGALDILAATMGAMVYALGGVASHDALILAPTVGPGRVIRGALREARRSRGDSSPLTSGREDAV